MRRGGKEEGWSSMLYRHVYVTFSWSWVHMYCEALYLGLTLFWNLLGLRFLITCSVQR